MQFQTIPEQLVSMAWALLFGAFCGAVYDAVRAVRFFLTEDKKGSLWAANVFDVLYSVFLAASYSIMVYLVNSGKNRWYLLFSAAAGFVLYRVSVGRIVLPLLKRTAAILRRILLKTVKIALIPMRSLIKMIKTVLKKLSARRKYKKTEKERSRRAKVFQAGRGR